MTGSRRAAWKYRWGRIRGPGGFHVFRRLLAQYADRAWTLGRHHVARAPRAEPFDGSPRFALVTVNFHTTRYLKLLLLTLSEQEMLGLVHRIVICDHASRDGGPVFLRELARRVDRVELVEHRHFRNHARGLRSCLRALERVEAPLSPSARTNLLLCCDTDVVFRSPETLANLAGTVLAHDAALVGEIRQGPNPEPDIQASFFVVRRDCYRSRGTVPFINDGSPAYRMQRSIWDAGLPVVHFPSNAGGFILHRGRGAVMATREFAPTSTYSTVPGEAHFMGVPDGERIWTDIEDRHAALLEPTAEAHLLDILGERFAQLGDVIVSD